MGLRSPQEMQKVSIRPEEATRFSGTVAPKLDKTFLDAWEAANKKKYEKQVEDFKTMEENFGDEEVIRANAELAQIEGLNTIKKSAEIRDRVKRSFEKRKQNLPEQFHDIADQVYAKKMVRFDKFAIPHTLGSIKKTVDEEDNKFIANKIDEAAEESGNLYEFENVSLPELQYGLQTKAARKFGNSPELIKSSVEMGLSKAIAKAVEQQSIVGRPDKANELFDKFDYMLTASDRVKVVKLLKKGAEDNETHMAKSLAEKAAELEDPREQEEFLRGATTTAEGYTKAKGILNSINTARTKSDTLNDTKAINAIFKDADNGLPLDPNKLNAIKDGMKKNKLIDTFNKNGGLANRVTDQKVRALLFRQLTSDSEGFKNTNLEEYKIALSPADYKDLETRQLALKERDIKRKEGIDYSTDKAVKDIMEQAIAQTLEVEEMKDVKEADFRASMADAYDRLIRSAPGLSMREIRMIFQDKVNKYMKSDKNDEVYEPSFINAYGRIPWWGFKDQINDYIPVHDHTEEEIERVRKIDPTMPMAGVLEFLDFKKNEQKNK